MSFEYDIPKCHYIRTNGTHCKSPALKGAQLCYHHQRDRKRVENFQQARGLKCDDYMNGHQQLQATLNPEIMESLDIPALDDAASIQVALTQMLRAICYDHISDRKAGLAIYCLQVAAMNLSRVQLAIAEGDTAATQDPQPIDHFSIGDGYHKHLARRGITMLKQQGNDERPPNKEERDQMRSEMVKTLTSVAKARSGF